MYHDCLKTTKGRVPWEYKEEKETTWCCHHCENFGVASCSSWSNAICDHKKHTSWELEDFWSYFPSQKVNMYKHIGLHLSPSKAIPRGWLKIYGSSLIHPNAPAIFSVRVHWKSRAKKVTHPNTTPVVDGSTSRFPRDPY